MSPKSPRHRSVLLAAVLMAALSACGPEHSVDLGVREVPTDILLKTQRDAVPPLGEPQAPPPVPGFPFVPTEVPQGPGRVDLPPPPDLVPQEPPAACPVSGPYATAPISPKRPAAGPAAGSYSVRVDGDYKISGARETTGRYGPVGKRTVTAAQPLPDDVGYTYTIADEQGLTTAYQVIPQQPADPDHPVNSANQPLPTEPGIYVTSFVYQRADGSKLSLNPSPPLMVAKLPLVAADRWTSRAVDVQSGVSISLNGQSGIGAKYDPFNARVDACGSLLGGYWVEYTVDTTPINDAAGNPEPPSQLSGPDIGIQFVGSRVAFGTLYGGLPIEELYVLKGTDKGYTVDIRKHSVYSTQPALAVSAAG